MPTGGHTAEPVNTGSETPTGGHTAKNRGSRKQKNPTGGHTAEPVNTGSEMPTGPSLLIVSLFCSLHPILL